MKKQAGILCILLTAAICFISGFIPYLKTVAKITHLMEENTEEDLRRQEVSPKTYEKFCRFEEKSSYSRYEYLTASILTGNTEKKELEQYLKLATRFEKDSFFAFVQAETAIWADLCYFPVPQPEETDTLTVAFENSWLTPRTFGGKRGHEGTDLMASLNERGHYPVVSVSDGTVEKMGWLPQGGYRIGIRAPHGAYFYYAHLYDYGEGISVGDSVKAGEFLGFMGDSGYGEEGTVGNFDVHLHFGIYLNRECRGKNGQVSLEEYSVNSYWILKYLEDKRLSSRYG